MKKYRQLFLILFLLQFLNIIWAAEKEVQILKVISVPDENTTYFIFLILDSNGEILRLKRQGPYDSEFYDFKKIIEGTALFKVDKKDVLFLECPNCDFIHGGEIKIRFLKNGITNQYSEIFIDLDKKNERWGFYTTDNVTLIKSVALKSNKLLGKVIGIKEIEINPR